MKSRSMIPRKKALECANIFHIYCEQTKMWQSTKWLGIPCFKFPFDAWVLQEIIYDIKPDIVIETGTAYGGSAVFIASILELLDYGKVITIDTNNKYKTNIDNDIAKYLWDTRVFPIIGDSISNEIIDQVHDHIYYDAKCLVLLDSWHRKEHVLKELELYSEFVSLDSYIIVEDTHVNGNPVPWKWGAGPMEAVDEFLVTNKHFKSDLDREKFFITCNPKGYLKRTNYKK